MKNTEPWFEFLSQACPEGKGFVKVQRSESPEGYLFLDLTTQNEKTSLQVRFAVSLVDSEGFSLPIHSGEISSAISSLDVRLRVARSNRPDLPLMVAAAPDILWPRSHAWMLGEYLAERDLPLWIDLRGLAEARVLEWMNRLSDTGLACPRLAVEIAFGGETCSQILSGSGAWVIGFVEELGGRQIGQM